MVLCIFCTLFLILYNLNNVLTHASNDVVDSETPHDSRYAIVVDAGSSGSRLFVYCIPSRKSDSSPLPSIHLCLDANGMPLSKKINPGLSSFSADPSASRAYISDLLSDAARNIPKQYHSITPVYILATAGMRLLNQSEQDAIWHYVRSTIKKEFHFKFEDSWAQTVTGFYEALYGWITVNYLLGNFVEPPRPTAGMLDMGGASMQIAYEVPPGLSPPKDLILPFTIGGTRTYNVYVMTFLGYGTHVAKSRYKSALLHNAMEYSQFMGLLKHRFRPSTGYVKPPKLANLTVEMHYTTNGQEKFIISDPCLQPGLEDGLNSDDLTISRAIRVLGNTSPPIVTFVGSGNLTLCIDYQTSLLQKQKPCKLNPCSMNGIHQPAVKFEDTNFYAMSEYWYTSSDLDPSTDTYIFTKFSTDALRICKTPWQSSLMEYQAKNVDSSAIVNKQNVCFKASWIMNVLHTGFGFSRDYKNLHPIEKLAGLEVQWSLGALIYYMQTPEFQGLLGQEPDSSTNSSTHQQTVAALVFFLFVIFSLGAYCLYSRRRPPARFDFTSSGSGGGSSGSGNRVPWPFKKFFSHPPKVINNGSVMGIPTGSGVMAKRLPTGNYHYSKITSPSVQVNFRSSSSVPTFQEFPGSGDPKASSANMV